MEDAVHVSPENCLMKTSVGSKRVDDGTQRTSFMDRASQARMPRRHCLEKVFGPDRRCRRSRLRPPKEGSIAEPPVEGRSGRKAKVFGSGAPCRAGWRVEPDAGASAGDRTFKRRLRTQPKGKHRMPSSRFRAGPRIGESGVGSDAGPICCGPALPAFCDQTYSLRWLGRRPSRYCPSAETRSRSATNCGRNGASTARTGDFAVWLRYKRPNPTGGSFHGH